jgi:hypothetical protein
MPPAKPCSEVGDSPWRIGDRVAAEIFGKHPLPRRVGQRDGEAGQRIGQGLVRQAERIVERVPRLHGEPDVEHAGGTHHVVRIHGLMVHDPQPGRDAPAQRLEVGRVLPRGHAAKMQFRGNAGRTDGMHDVFQAAAGTDGLTEPVEAKRSRPRSVWLLAWQGEYVVDCDRRHAEALFAGTSDGSASHRDKRRLPEGVGHDCFCQAVTNRFPDPCALLTTMKVLEVHGTGRGASTGGFRHRG